LERAKPCDRPGEAQARNGAGRCGLAGPPRALGIQAMSVDTLAAVAGGNNVTGDCYPSGAGWHGAGEWS